MRLKSEGDGLGRWEKSDRGLFGGGHCKHSDFACENESVST